MTDQDRWELYAPWLEHEDRAVRANALICLINQANYLLDQQIAALEEQFVGEGGYSEQLAARRMAARAEKKTEHIPDCPKCGRPMALRTARSGKNEGKQFWGCTGYPDCKGTAEL